MTGATQFNITPGQMMSLLSAKEVVEPKGMEARYVNIGYQLMPVAGAS